MFLRLPAASQQISYAILMRQTTSWIPLYRCLLAPHLYEPRFFEHIATELTALTLGNFTVVHRRVEVLGCLQDAEALAVNSGIDRIPVTQRMGNSDCFSSSSICSRASSSSLVV